MNEPHSANPYFELALAEHRALHRMLRETQAAVALACQAADPKSAGRSAKEQISRLFEHVREHFAQEEAGGYLEEATSIVPRLGPDAAELERQHGTLLARLKYLLNSAAVAMDKKDWEEVDGYFRTLAAELHEHEVAEDRILQQAGAAAIDPDV